MSSKVSMSYTDPTSWNFHNINDAKALEVAEKVIANSTLVALSIIGPFESNYEGLSKIGGKAILNAVREHHSIQALNLEGNNEMGDDIALVVYKMLKENTSLLSLNLRDCGLSDKAVDIIAAGLKTNQTLKTLQINTNLFGESGFKKLKNAADERGVALDLS